jgi:hypothetical protein
LAAHPSSTLFASASLSRHREREEKSKRNMISFSRTTVDDAYLFTSFYNPVLCEITYIFVSLSLKGTVEGEVEKEQNETNGVKIVQAILSIHIETGKNQGTINLMFW